VNGTADDVNAVASQSSSVGGRTDGIVLTAGDVRTITFDSTNGKISATISYSGTNSAAKYSRSGSVTFTLTGKKWNIIGSKIQVVYNNLTYTRNSDGKSISLSGTLTHLNSTGGTAFSAATSYDGNTVVHKIYGTLDITYSDTTSTATAIWNINKLRKWTSPSAANALTYTVSGDTTGSFLGLSLSSVSDFGTNRRGKPFYVVNTGVSVNNCGTATSAPVYRALGLVKTYFNLGILSIQFGASSSSGAPAGTPCSGAGIYYSWSTIGGTVLLSDYTAY
jgi:hypothetical protein